MQSMGWSTSMIGNLGEPLDQQWYSSSSGASSSDFRAVPGSLAPTSLSASDSPTCVEGGEELFEDADGWIPDDIELQVVG